jgi:regulator of protease activity HflC (stomatin/prohibitin superfamily)
MDMFGLPLLAILVVVAVVIALQIFKVLNEYERGVVLTFGRFTGVKGPGLIILIPLIQKMIKVDLRVIVLDVPTQDVISRDNVSVKVNAVVYFRIVDPAKVVIQVASPFEATSQLAQTTLRSVLGQHELDEMLSQREKLNLDIQRILDQATDAWGIKVQNVEIKHVDLDESMIRSIAKQAEAERTRRAKIIHAEGERQAASQLVEAARELATQPNALQLRYLQTLADITNDKTSTIVFPIPIDILKPFYERAAPVAAATAAERLPGSSRD